VHRTKKDRDVEIACRFFVRGGHKSIKEGESHRNPMEGVCMHGWLVVVCVMVVVVGTGGEGR